jgi:hypothetical protein
MRIYLSRLDIGMAQDFLDEPDIRPLVHQIRGKLTSSDLPPLSRAVMTDGVRMMS